MTSGPFQAEAGGSQVADSADSILLRTQTVAEAVGWKEWRFAMPEVVLRRGCAIAMEKLIKSRCVL